MSDDLKDFHTFNETWGKPEFLLILFVLFACITVSELRSRLEKLEKRIEVFESNQPAEKTK